MMEKEARKQIEDKIENDQYKSDSEVLNDIALYQHFGSESESDKKRWVAELLNKMRTRICNARVADKIVNLKNFADQTVDRLKATEFAWCMKVLLNNM
jgi:Arc/MetJ-type ribon-helix-helix transcriptional regulator